MGIIKKLLPKKDTGLFKKILFWCAASFIALFTLGTLAVAGMVTMLSVGLPDVTNLENLTAAQSTEIFDRDGNLLYTIHGEENREQIEYEDFSSYVLDATVAVEDDTFWEHGGFDILAIGKAVLYELFGVGNPRGGSTLTQQYVKNTFLSSERTYTRKIKELILSVRLERSYSKEEILGLYLNRIPYGNNAYGTQKAAEIYFGKNAKDLTLAEASVLAALPQAPSRYNPFGDNKYSHLLKEFSEDELKSRSITHETDLEIEEYARGLIGQHVKVGENQVYIAGRTDIVLKRMAELGMIDQSERQRALDELQRLEFRKHEEKIQHPHFVLYIKQVLEDRYGTEILEQGGLKIYTTLDPKIQEVAEQTLADNAASNLSRFNADNAATMTINAKTGQILAMVGSVDYWNEEIDGNVNVALRPRQPGSSFKPIAYAQAFYNGYGPGNVIYDVPTKIGANRPQNYDGGWGGQMSVRRALAQSRNIPAIKMYYLAEEQGPVIELAQKMGITTLDPNHSYGYPLALGAGEVPLIEMAQAYAVFANGGKRPELTGILKVENNNGDILEEWTQQEFEEVLDPQIAYSINDILSDQENGIGPRLYIPGEVNAAKTGTSTKSNKQDTGGSVRPSDTWTIGYTPTLVTAVWVGNTDGEGLGLSANGYDAAAPLFREIMTTALESVPAEPFPRPEGIKTVAVSKASGKLPGPNTPASYIVEDIFPSFSVPTEEENLFFTSRVDRISGLLPNEYTPEECIQEVTFQKYEPIADLLNWANEIQAYYAGRQLADNENGEEGEDSKSSGIIGSPPTEFDNVHNAETKLNAPVITIISPTSNSKVAPGTVPVEIKLSAANGVDVVEYYVDNQKTFLTSSPPYTGEIRVSPLTPNGSRHLIVVKATDSLCYSSQSAVEIKIDRNSEDPEEEDPSQDPDQGNGNGNGNNNGSGNGSGTTNPTPPIQDPLDPIIPDPIEEGVLPEDPLSML